MRILGRTVSAKTFSASLSTLFVAWMYFDVVCVEVHLRGCVFYAEFFVE